MISEEFRIRKFAHESSLTDLGQYVTGMVISVDMDQVPYGRATVTLGGCPDDVITLIDPRSSDGEEFRIQVARIADDEPDDGHSIDLHALMLGRSLDVVGNTATLELTTREFRMMDRLRMFGTTYDTGATTLQELVDFAISTGDPTRAATWSDNTVSLPSVSIPSGDRRLWQPGESCWDLIESELNARDIRLYCTLLGTYSTRSRTSSWPGATLTASAVSKAYDLYVTDLSKTIDRGEWANGVVVHFTWTKGDGTQGEAWQSDGTSATKGLSLAYQRPPTSNNLATVIRARAMRRGSSFDIACNINFSATPGSTITLRRKGRVPTTLGTIRATTWDLSTGVMTLQSEIGAPA